MMDFMLDKQRRNPTNRLPANYVWHSAEQKVKVTMPARQILSTQEQSAGQLRLAYIRAKGQGNHALNHQEVFERTQVTHRRTNHTMLSGVCLYLHDMRTKAPSPSQSVEHKMEFSHSVVNFTI